MSSIKLTVDELTSKARSNVAFAVRSPDSTRPL